MEVIMWVKVSLLLVAFSSVCLATSVDSLSCSSYVLCEQCIRNGCAWCKDEELGVQPRCMEKTEVNASGCKDHTSSAPSILRVLKNLPDVLVSPQEIMLKVEYGDPVTYVLEIRTPEQLGTKNKLLIKYQSRRMWHKQKIDVQNLKSRSFERKGKDGYVLVKNVKPGAMIKANVTIESLLCETIKRKTKIIVRLMEKGRKPLKAKVKISLPKTTCPCKCQDIEEKSARCSRHGRYECGKCVCDKGFIGKECEQDSQDVGTCTAPGSQKECSGRGQCQNGACLCYEIRNGPGLKYTGQYCECDDSACPYHDNKICGGNGQCVCGQCVCNPGFMGDSCSCSTSTESCLASNGAICNNNGPCICGKCRCDPYNMFAGPTCEDCMHKEINSMRCAGHGIWECGTCKCDTGYHGNNCQFYGDAGPELEAQCISPNGPDVVCSGRGTCFFGMCDCNPISVNSYKKYSGRFCQCNDYSCPFFANYMCGGTGRCVCGKCVCDESFTGENCGCSTAVDTCMASNGMVCNGQGTCECGFCRCNKDTSYRGPTCEDCPTCPSRCKRLKPCVECVAFSSGSLSPEECRERCDMDNIYLVEKLPDLSTGGITLCTFEDEDACRFKFTYEFQRRGRITALLTSVKGVKECPGI